MYENATDKWEENGVTIAVYVQSRQSVHKEMNSFLFFPVEKFWNEYKRRHLNLDASQIRQFIYENTLSLTELQQT